MECLDCGTTNRAGRHFCATCGVPLPSRCAACGFTNHPGERFCGGCSLRLAAPPRAPAATWLGPDRRPLTVMFCDLVGSTPLSTRLDPEDLRDLVRQYQEACARAIAHYDGYISRFMGDGILVFFGYPTAQEDAAERATRAGLAALDALAALCRSTERVHGLELGVRIGIATGLVVAGDLIGEGAAEERAVVGETPNLAARLQGMAPLNGMLVADRTYRLVHALFECEDLGPQQIRGFATPQRVWRVLRARSAVRRFEASADTSRPRMVNRDAERARLESAWQHACEGRDGVVWVSGEGGIGKSRLVDELRATAKGVGHVRVLRCSPHYASSALHPILELLQGELELESRADATARLQRLEQRLADCDVPRSPALPLLAALLELPLPGAEAPAPELSPQRARQEIHRALVGLLSAPAGTAPLLCIWEDLQWADPSSLEVLGELIDHGRGRRQLLLLTARPDVAPPPGWLDGPDRQRLDLGPLSREHVGDLVSSLTGARAFSAQVLEQVVGRADGVPLFAEELARMLAEVPESQRRATLRGASLGIPESLHDSLMARLDRIASAKEVVQVAAALGRRFDAADLLRVTDLEAPAIDVALAQLVEARLIVQSSDASGRRYAFRHALIQDAAYQSMLRSHRRAVHRRIADTWLTASDGVEPEIIALHLTEAGDARAAVPHWIRAGDRARAAFDNAEALHHYQRALELLRELPQDAERVRLELTVLVSMGLPLAATQSYAAHEVGEVYARARALATQLGPTLDLFPILHGLYRFYFVRAELDAALEISHRLLALAESSDIRALRLEASRALGFTLSMRGDAEQAAQHLEHASALYQPDEDAGHMRIFGTDPFVASRSNLAAAVLVGRGEPRQARQAIEQALARARELQHPFTLAWTLTYAAVVYQQCDDGPATERAAHDCMAVATEHGMPFWLAGAQILYGWALAHRGQQGDALELVASGVTRWRQTGARVYLPYYLCLWGQLLAEAGKLEDALATLRDARAQLEETGERWWAAEVERSSGELLQRQALERGTQARGTGCAPAAERHFARAIEQARAQGMAALELRAWLSWNDAAPSQERLDSIRALARRLAPGGPSPELRRAHARTGEPPGPLHSGVYRSSSSGA